MSNKPECILTGCYFHSPTEGRYIRGDLHRIGECYVVTGNTTRGANGDWIYGAPPTDDMLVSALQATYLEKRGVVVFTTNVAVFNDHASEYITKWAVPRPTV